MANRFAGETEPERRDPELDGDAQMCGLEQHREMVANRGCAVNPNQAPRAVFSRKMLSDEIGEFTMRNSILVEMNLPKDWKTFRLPKALDDRLQELLDRQNEVGRLPPIDRERPDRSAR